jgi:hypothetical protein
MTARLAVEETATEIGNPRRRGLAMLDATTAPGLDVVMHLEPLRLDSGPATRTIPFGVRPYYVS